MAAVSTAAARRLIAYFRDCLVEDGGERQILDVFGRDEREHLLFVCPASDWRDPGLIALPEAYAERLLALLALQREERELTLGACLVTGPAGESGGRTRGVRTPLLLYNVELVHQDGKHAVRVEPESLRLNPAALEALGVAEDRLLAADGAVDLARVQKLLMSCERRGYEARPEGYPRWRDKEPVRWVAAGVLWATARSFVARSIAHELDSLSTGKAELAPPLLQILGAAVAPPRKVSEPVPETLPTRLTAAQERALRNACTDTLSVINGPPGTGKTYTIACLAADRVLRGERVLLVCSNEHAADVARAKLAELFGGAAALVVRAGRGNYRAELLERLDELLGGEAASAAGDPAEVLRGRLREGAAGHRDREAEFRQALADAVAEGDLQHARGTWTALRRWWLRRKLARAPLLGLRWQALQHSMRAHQALAREYLAALAARRLGALIEQRRPQLAALATALRSRASGHRQSRFAALDWQVLTQAFPVWVVSAQALHRVLPLEKALFDLVVLDEATQCNLPQALPALQRAQRAVVVGDPKQLRHYSFLAVARQRALAERHQVSETGVNLDYRERSLLDYALDAVPRGEAIVLLDEHFRSHPALIAFSNRRFYGERLKILTRLAHQRPHPPFQQVDCGLRLEGEVNSAEIEAVLARLHALIEDSRELPDHECPSIGVLAFFRSTALRLERELLARYDLRTISRHDLRAGTPYAFQGEERDVMLLATGLYPGRARAAWTYLDRPEVFNVAVTRARHRQVLFIAEGALAEGAGSLLADYLAGFAAAPSPTPAMSSDTDAIRRELAAELEALGARCRSDFPFAGQTLDLLVLHDERALGVDLVGTASAVGRAWDWAHYRLLERAGLALFPVSAWAWRERRGEVLAALRAALGLDEGAPPAPLPERSEALRWRLRELRDPELLGLLDELERNHQQARMWLEQHFAPTELTYLRYRDSIDRLRQAAAAELQGACLLLDGLRELAPERVDAKLRAEVHKRVDGCRKAVAGLSGLTAQLALLRTEASGLDEALAEVRRLAERVPRYGVKE